MTNPLDLNIMIVDDQRTTRMLVRTSLRELGYRNVVECGDGEEALRVLGESPTQLIISDVNMPKMDGLALLKAVRAKDEHKRTPFIMLTGRGDVALVSLTHVPTNGGLVNPAAPIGALARSAGVPFLLDACQAVGQLDLDVEAIGCDFLSATGRKFLRGPRGTGFLYVRESILDRVRPSQPDHHGADLVASDRYELAPGAQRFEYWEYDHAAWLGLGAAVEHALGWGTDRIEATVVERAAQLRERLADAGFRLYDQGIQQCGIVTVGSAEPDGRTAEELAARLTEHRIHSSLAVANSARYDFERRDLPTLVRLSVHYTTTVGELDRTVEVLAGA